MDNLDTLDRINKMTAEQIAQEISEMKWSLTLLHSAADEVRLSLLAVDQGVEPSVIEDLGAAIGKAENYL